MKYLLFNMRLFPALLFSFLLVCFYSCKDEEILQIVVGPEPPKSENTIDDINSNLKALQRMVVAQEKGLDVRSCVALTASSYNVELSDGNSFIVHTEITPLDKGESPVYAPKLGVKKEGDIYYWTIDDDWLNIKDAKVAVTPELSSIPVVGMDEDGYWTVKCNDDVKTLKRRAEAGTVKSIFNQVDIKGKTVTFRFSDGSLPIAFTIDDKDNPDEPVMGDLRRPISSDKPAWIFHIDTWNHADPQRIIDMIPADIRPYVIFNISLSVLHDDDTGKWGLVEYGYEVAKSWLRTCAENNVWAMVQPSSGGFSHFPDFATYGQMEGSLYEEFYRDYPNFLGFNYCEQFWGFDDPFSVSYPQRLKHWTNLMKLNAKYGGYLTISFCGPHWGASLTPVAMFKRDAEFAAVCREHPENLIVCEKYTSTYGFFDIESACLGAWLSGYAGQYGMRFDECGWNAIYWNGDEKFPVAAGAIPAIEHIMFTGQTIFDGPETIPEQVCKEVNAVSAGDGYTRRNWEFYPQLYNINMDIYRKILDGTIRIMNRQEVIDRTKYVIVNDITPNNTASDPGYLAPKTLYDGLYKLDEDGTNYEQRLYFKKTGRYPTLPVVYGLVDDIANSFRYKINASQYNGTYGDVKLKQSIFNRDFPEEYTGNLYVGRHENAWVAYNAYAEIRNAAIPFKYNTCEKMELAFAKYSVSAIKEYSDKVTFYLTNYNEKGIKQTDVIKIYGSTNKPKMTYTDRATPASCSISEDWTNGVYTMTVIHNGAVDITVNCAGNAIGRETQYTKATINVPANPNIYHGARQYEAENFEYKNISRIITKKPYSDTEGILPDYTAMGFLNFGSNGNAAVRDEVSVTDTGNYSLRIRYCAAATVNTVDLYVNGVKVTTLEFAQTGVGNWETTSAGVSLNAGKNKVELIANGSSASCDLYLDNIVIE